MPKQSPIIIFFLAVVILATPLLGYTQSYDEFLKKVEQAVSKREKAEVYLEMGEDFIEDEPERALELANQLVILVEGQPNKQARSHFFRGQAQYYLDQNDGAIRSFQIADSLASKNNQNDPILRANILSYWGSTLLFIGDYSSALGISRNALEYANKTEDQDLRSGILTDLSFINLQLGNYEESLKQRFEAYQIHKENNDSTEIKIDLNELAMIYSNRDQLDEAISYLKESQKFISKDSELSDYLTLYINLSNTYIKKYSVDSNLVHLDSTEFYLDKGLRISSNQVNVRELIPLYLNYSNLEIKRSAYQLASQYVDDADDLIQELNETAFLPRSFEIRSRIEYEKRNYGQTIKLIDDFIDTNEQDLPADIKLTLLKRKGDALKKLGRFKEALSNIEQYIEVRNDYVKQQSTSELEKFRTLYETDLKEERILRLEQLRKEEAKRRKVGFSVLLALLDLSVGFMLFLRYTFQQRKQIRALEFEREISQRDGQIELLQERVSNFVDQPIRENKAKEELPELEILNSSLLTQITEREYEVLKSIEQGLTNKEIAEAHFISVNTVKYHLRNIYTKLDVSNRIQVIQRLRNFG